MKHVHLSLAEDFIMSQIFIDFVCALNSSVSLIFTLCFAYQYYYIYISAVRKPLVFPEAEPKRYAFVISARNEDKVIGNLVESIKRQNYPAELIDVYVVADNCDDSTANAARNAGAIVYERFNTVELGKSYALNYLFARIKDDKRDVYDGYFVFDADNVLDENYVREMNKVFCAGYKVVTSYRNSKNYNSNWLSAAYSLSFLREARFLNNARMILGVSCCVSGTGFLISSEIVKKNNGWKHNLLTEDIEFSTDCIIEGEKIGYCHSACFYDEQPVSFKQSVHQRMRWAKGFYQILANYGTRLLSGICKGSFSCFDMLMTISPAMILSLVTIIANISVLIIGLATANPGVPQMLSTLAESFGIFYCMFFLLGFFTLVAEWKSIYCKWYKKIIYLFAFPLFYFSYIPIAIGALFRRVEWSPIKHTIIKKAEDIKNYE